MAVVVEDRLAAIDPVLPAGDACARLALGAVQDLVDRFEHRRGAVVGDEREQPPLAHAGRADHGAQVAHEVVRVADIGGDHAQHVVAQLAGVVELERRDPEPLLPDLSRARVVGAVGRAADVALMGTVDRPERDVAADEHRHERCQVRQVIVSVVGVIQEIDVAGLHSSLEGIAHRLDRPRDRADVNGHVLGLRDQTRSRVAERGGEVPARVEDLRVRRAEHRLAHLLHDGLEAMRQDRHRHWVAHDLKIYRDRGIVVNRDESGSALATGDGNVRVTGVRGSAPRGSPRRSGARRWPARPASPGA
jgi:hypothetical protein